MKKMPELSLEKQIGEIKLAMDAYLDFSKNNCTPNQDCSFKILEKLGIVDDSTLQKWVIKYNPRSVNDLHIKEEIKSYLGYSIFHTLFKQKRKINPYIETWLDTRLGLCFMEIYHKKTKGIEISFFDDLRPITPPTITDYHYNPPKRDHPLKEVLILKYKGLFESRCEMPDYLKSKKYLKKSLKLLHKEKLNLNTPEFVKRWKDIIGSWTDYATELKTGKKQKNKEHPGLQIKGLEGRLKIELSRAESQYKEWVKNYNEMKNLLKKSFPTNKFLTNRQHYSLYENLKELKNKIYTEEELLGGTIRGAHLSSIKRYLLRFIKVLKKESPQLNDLISNIYVLCSTFKKEEPYNDRKEEYYLKKALEANETNLEAYHKLGSYYENCGNEAQASENWKKLIQYYFKKTNKINLKKIKNSTNEIGKIEDFNLEPWILDRFIIKKSKKDTLAKEHHLMKSIADKNYNGGTVLKPVTYIQYKDGYDYLVMREMETVFAPKWDSWEKVSDKIMSLSEVIEYVDKLESEKVAFEKFGIISKKEILDHFKVKYLKNSLKKLTDLQRIISSLDLKIEKYDFKDITKNKISKRLKGGKPLTTALEFLTERINSQEKCFTHGDYHLGNILVKQAEIIPIDFEYVSYMPLLYDPLFLLEDPNLDIDRNTKQEFIKYYLKEKNIEFNEHWKKDIDYMSLFVTLRWAGIFSKWESLTKDEKYTNIKWTYLKKSEKLIDKILIYASDTEYPSLQTLKNCLKGMLY